MASFIASAMYLTLPPPPPSPLPVARSRSGSSSLTHLRAHTRTRARTHTQTQNNTHTQRTCIQASSQAIRREQSITQIGQGSTHVAHHVMLNQQSFKRGGRGRSQIVETRQGSKIDRREGEGGEHRAGLRKGVRGKRRVLSKQCRSLHDESLAWYLPNTYLPQGIWSRAPFASEKEEYLSSSSLVATPRVGFEYTFFSCSSFLPRPLPSLSPRS